MLNEHRAQRFLLYMVFGPPVCIVPQQIHCLRPSVSRNSVWLPAWCRRLQLTDEGLVDMVFGLNATAEAQTGVVSIALGVISDGM